MQDIGCFVIRVVGASCSKPPAARLARHGALGDTIGRARHFGAIARDALAPLPATPHKEALLDVVDFCISRLN